MKKEITTKINDFFRDKEYKKVDSVDISSGFDPSVTFIGSGISVLKEDLINEKINKNGEYIIQKAIRTQSLKDIYDLQKDNRYYSFFEAFCALHEYSKLDNLVSDTFDFFLTKLKLNQDEVLIRINEEDKDLIETINNYKYKINMEFNTEEYNKYRHKYGLDSMGIYGRNFNVALLNRKTNTFDDAGNIVVIENKEKQYGCEFAIGIEPILMAIHGQTYSLNCSIVSELLPLKSIEQRKFAECFVVVANLLYEDIEKNKHRYPRYLYKKYLTALKFWATNLKISLDFIEKKMLEYIAIEYERENNITLDLKL